MTRPETGPAEFDDSADEAISECLLLANPKSFFLYAGAGSGKTRSLVDGVRGVLELSSRELEIRGQAIAVITYTNAAANEIGRRLEFNPLVVVSTIHSFAWNLVKPFQPDIREWLRVSLVDETLALEAKSSRAGTKAEATRVNRIARNNERLGQLDQIALFSYNPAGTNSSQDSLNHSEVIQLASSLLSEKAALQSTLVNRHPILLVDESQDTNKSFMNALLTVEGQHRGRFCLGLLGDTMQRIYNDGKLRLDEAIPEAWGRPEKRMNHRSSLRVIELVNQIRHETDGRAQVAREGAPEGTVRFFVAKVGQDVTATEELASQRMAVVAGDEGWRFDRTSSAEPSRDGVMTLILEHAMAARRMGFETVYSALSKIERARTGLLDGSIAGLQLFLRDVGPLVHASKGGDDYEVARLVRLSSPLLAAERLIPAPGEQNDSLQHLKLAREAVAALLELWIDGEVPTLLAIAKRVAESKLFVVPTEIADALNSHNNPALDDNEAEPETAAWLECLGAKFDEVDAYGRYVGNDSLFSTHQAVKGLEFPRVMLVISDEEARGFMFSYQRLFGWVEEPVAAPSAAVSSGEDTESSTDRTRRLFYVTCSRAEISLAIVAYAVDPEELKRLVVDRGWFAPEEVELLA